MTTFRPSPMGVPNDVKEFFDPPEVVASKIKQLAQMVKNSHHMVMFTGAGLSTSSGIPDFRGPQGVWTLREKGIRVTRPAFSRIEPTSGHNVIAGLIDASYLKYLISQNTDGLHVRSGVPVTAISELNGNTNIESCPNCKRRYWRKFGVREARGLNDHETSRRCDNCLATLNDTIVNFGESLQRSELENAFKESAQSDLHIVLGSSLLVSPANELPQTTIKSGGKLVIVNLQRTPLDNLAALRIFARTDEVLLGLAHELGLQIPSNDLEADRSLDGMVIVNETPRKNLGMVQENKEQLMEHSPRKLKDALENRGLKVPQDVFEKGDLAEAVMKKCRNFVYWV